MKTLVYAVCLLSLSKVYSQNSIEWDGLYQLQLSDFQSTTTQIGGVSIVSLHGVAGVEFAYQMTNGEFMFTKNFNSKVNCTFKRNIASLIAPDTTHALDLLNFARYEFDLSELYARKLRKNIYEGKTAFSNPSFLQPLYDQLQKEFMERDANAVKATELGRDKVKLEELHATVLTEIATLSEFCKQCKPSRKKK